MTMYVYAIYNMHSELYDGLFLFRTDKHAQFELTNRVPPRQQAHCDLVKVGTFDISTGVINHLQPTAIAWAELTVDDVSDKTPISSDSPQKQLVDFVNKTS